MRNSITVKIVSLMVVLVGISGQVQARIVISKEKQSELLQAARVMLNPVASSVPDAVKDPFHRPVVVKVVKPVVVEEKPEVVEVVRELSDSEVLALAAQKLKPSGFIDQGGQQYMILNGKKVQDGVSFNFPHENKRYSIKINQIQTNSFTLNLNAESKTISME